MLPLFPGAYIDDSLLTAVFVGVLLLWWLAERLGWPATGLVVPGYLGSILAIRPDAAATVAVEAVITAAIADVLGRRMQTWGVPIDVAFGRDRFFLIVLTSAFVRIAVEVAPGPTALEWLGVTRVDGWHSIGLVLVPLTANALWKPGIFKGVPLVGLPVLAVYALLRFVLLPYTNLSLVTLELTYADLEWSFLGAPRVYILLLIGAFIASHTTIRFGWDFGGIIVCGLLAIAWLEPLKIAATYLEVAVVVGIVRLLVAVPPLKTANLSGLRPVVLAFTVSYAVKLTLAAVGQGMWPTFRTSDLFGFGYLLPALLATRAYRAGQLTRVLVPTTVVSFLGFALGSVVGISLAMLRDGEVAPAGELAARGGPARIAVIEALGPAVDEPLALPRDEARLAVARALSGRPHLGGRLRVDVFEDGAVLSTDPTRGPPLSLWVRPEGRPDLELWVDDAAAPGLAEAAVGLALRLDAGLVALDADPLWRQVHDGDAAVVRVVLGEQAGFTGGEPLRAPVAALLPALPEAEPATAVLDPAAVEALAVEALAGAPPLAALEPAALALHRYARAVVDPVLDGREALAAAWGPRLGLAVREGEVLPLGAGPWAVEARLHPGGAPVAVEVRGGDESVAAVGRSWAARVDASAWLVVHDELAADAARVWLRGLAARRPGLEVLSIDRLGHDDVVGGDAVVWDGRPASPVHRPSPVAARAVDLLVADGFLPALADGSIARAGFNDGGDRRRLAVEPFGGSVATVWLGLPVRRAHGGLAPGAPHRLALEAAGIAVQAGSLEALAVGEPVRDAGMDALWSILARHAATGHPGALARLVDEVGPTGRVRAIAGPAGRALLVVERDGLVGVAPLGYAGRPARVGDVALPGAWRAR